ncbi:hypothetical protein K1719_011832 [Acacia pycnantha]|nr:hypothetical protein K1719_011832 [Acacia pycnantha]
MHTTWTIARFVRWRVRDWASCFLTLDDEPASSPRMDNRVNHVYDSRLSRASKKKETKNNRRGKDKNEASVEHNTVDDDSSWSNFADEDYIVFCFREDGAFDVIRDGKCVKSQPPIGIDGSSRNSRPVNRMLNYCEDEEQVSKQSTQDDRPNVNQYPSSSYNKQDEESDIIYMSRQQKRDNIRKVEDRAVVSSGSRDSNQSEGSTGSFAFPVLGWEWMGSPVQLPRSESKHKFRFLRFRCCRF